MKGGYTDQLNQDWGHHEILFGLAGHAGEWREGQTDWQAYRLSTPLVAFTVAPYRPWNAGSRCSAKAARPSAASAVPKQMVCSRRS